MRPGRKTRLWKTCPAAALLSHYSLKTIFHRYAIFPRWSTYPGFISIPHPPSAPSCSPKRRFVCSTLVPQNVCLVPTTYQMSHLFFLTVPPIMPHRPAPGCPPPFRTRKTHRFYPHCFSLCASGLIPIPMSGRPQPRFIPRHVSQKCWPAARRISGQRFGGNSGG